MIGKRIGENKLITEPTFQFAPADTVYVSVSTEGMPESAELTAKWRFQTGQTVDSSTQTIRPTGAGEHRVPRLESQGLAGRDLQRDHLRQRRLGGLEELRGEEVAGAGLSCRMARHWVLKTEPSTYAFPDLVRERRTRWEGVSNAVALKHLRSMLEGDDALIYHTGNEKSLIGLARIASAPYPDPGRRIRGSWSWTSRRGSRSPGR